MLREEGLLTFYKPLAPRLVSVVPMIGIQFGVYEFMKRTIGNLPAPLGKIVPYAAPTPPKPKLSDEQLAELFDEIEDSV